jgi:hypothetical protein
VTSEIDLTRLDPLLKSVGWTREEAERDLRVDFTKPVSSDIKNHLWQAIQIANRFKMFYPQTKVTGMRYVNPGNGGGDRHPGTGIGG